MLKLFTNYYFPRQCLWICCFHFEADLDGGSLQNYKKVEQLPMIHHFREMLSNSLGRI